MHEQSATLAFVVRFEVFTLFLGRQFLGATWGKSRDEWFKSQACRCHPESDVRVRW